VRSFNLLNQIENLLISGLIYYKLGDLLNLLIYRIGGEWID